MKEKVLEVKGLNKYYGKVHVLKDINFDIYENEIVGFVGHNGSGKSTTMKCICNLVHTSSGEIIVNGHDLRKDRNLALACQSSQIEHPGLYGDLSGYDNLLLMAKLKGVNNQRVEEVIEFIGIGEKLKMMVSEYSMGMKQRLALGIAILNKPKFLMLDEPTNGLDPQGIIQLRKMIFELRNQGTSILFSSHQLGEVEKLCDRILWINKGIVVERSDLNFDKITYEFLVDEIDKALNLIQSMLGKENVWVNVKGYLSVSISKDGLNEIITKLVEQGIAFNQIERDVHSIETIYNEVYGCEV